MKNSTHFIRVLALVLLSFWAVASVRAQGEPTLDQIYQAANQGQLARAHTMIDQVINTHPSSAKAHYVKAEIAARERNLTLARQELATAESLAPGLPFAKPEAAQALRRELQAPAAGSSPRQMGAAPDDRPAPARGLPWSTIAVVAAVIGIGAVLMRRRAATREAGAYGGVAGPGAANAGPYAQQPGYGPNNGPGAPQGPYPQGPNPPMQPGGGAYGQPSMGSSIMRGVGTGLAVGAGAVAATEIGRRIFSHDRPNESTDLAGGAAPDVNADMGGDDFGVRGGGWDDAAGGSIADGDLGAGDIGGGDWNT
jgi:hypothetical protein